MGLKYQTEIDSRAFKIVCPSATLQPDNMEAYRFVFDTIEHEDNFLPNVVFDSKKGIPYNYERATEEMVCSRCGISLYISLANAKSAWQNLAPKIKENLGYNHIAKGVLIQTDGLMKEVNQYGHFGFYEDEDAGLANKFEIIDSL